MADSPTIRKPRLSVATAPSQDALASLPIDVLDNTLSRLHIYDVVRTSALSRAWRRRWESLPTIDLSRSPGISASDVDALLLRRSAPVRTFRLPARDTSWSEGAFHDWLVYLSRRGVRHLDLRFPRPAVTIHSSLFSCRELTSLSLFNCCVRPPPAGFAGFPNLRTLRLRTVIVQRLAVQEHAGRALEALIGASPTLQEVELFSVELLGDSPDEDWMIRAPHLRRLTIISDFDYGGRAEDFPRLEEGVLFGPNYAKFLTGMVGVTKLEFYCNCILPTEVDVLEQLPFLFENLRSLVIAANFCKVSHVLSIFCLLRRAPVLEELVVWGWSDGTQEIEANNEFLKAQYAGHIFTRLHVVHLKNIKYHTNEMHFMEFVLSNAQVLQLLSVTLAPCAPCNKEIVNEITAYPIASFDAQVVFMGRESESANDKSTKNSDEGTQTDEAHPRRRHRVNSESVAQVEQLGEELQKLENEREHVFVDRSRLFEEMRATINESRKFREYTKSAMQLLLERCNIKCLEHSQVHQG